MSHSLASAAVSSRSEPVASNVLMISLAMELVSSLAWEGETGC
jgi:hypothetical protein